MKHMDLPQHLKHKLRSAGAPRPTHVRYFKLALHTQHVTEVLGRSALVKRCQKVSLLDLGQLGWECLQTVWAWMCSGDWWTNKRQSLGQPGSWVTGLWCTAGANKQFAP